MKTTIMKSIKYKIKSFPKFNAVKLMKRIEKYEYISFDIFDTLIKRNVPNPQDVFRLVQLRYEKNTGKKIEGFKENRVQAENKARKFTEKEEILLEEIYECMTQYTAEIRNELKMLECKIELDICCMNLEMMPVYQWSLENRKKIILISDMYLPQKVIEEILHKNKINGYKKLYLSSTIRLSKKTGALYEQVLKDFHITNKQLIHIGDCWKNDYLMARNKGINAIIIPRYIKRIKHDSNKGIAKEDCFSYNCIKSFINNHVPKESSSYLKYGYEALGILLYGFSRWLLESLNQKRIQRVFFLSRDGYIMKKAFDILNKDKAISSHYLYVSRRSLRVPQLWMEPELQNVVKNFSPATMLTVSTFMDNIGLNAEEYLNVLNQYGFNKKDIIKRNDILTNIRIVKLYETLKDIIVEKSKQEYILLLKYLKQNSFSGQVAVVDIGWHGSMQHSLIKLAECAGLSVDIHGYYFGIAPEARRYTNEIPMEIAGYIFDCNSSSNDYDMRSPFIGLFETFFIAQEGSTKQYEYNEHDSKVVPVLYDYEYSINDNFSKEGEKNKEIQTGAINFIKDIINYTDLQLLSFEPKTAFRNIFYTGTYPKKQDLEMFAGFRFFDGEINYLAKPKSLICYCLHPKMLIKDIHFSRWKVGFMKKLFKIPLPYNKIFWLLKKI